MSYLPLTTGKIARFTVKQSFSRLSSMLKDGQKMPPMHATLTVGVNRCVISPLPENYFYKYHIMAAFLKTVSLCFIKKIQGKQWLIICFSYLYITKCYQNNDLFSGTTWSYWLLHPLRRKGKYTTFVHLCVFSTVYYIMINLYKAFCR